MLKRLSHSTLVTEIQSAVVHVHYLENRGNISSALIILLHTVDKCIFWENQDSILCNTGHSSSSLSVSSNPAIWFISFWYPWWHVVTMDFCNSLLLTKEQDAFSWASLTTESSNKKLKSIKIRLSLRKVFFSGSMLNIFSHELVILVL